MDDYDPILVSEALRKQAYEFRRRPNISQVMLEAACLLRERARVEEHWEAREQRLRDELAEIGALAIEALHALRERDPESVLRVELRARETYEAGKRSSRKFRTDMALATANGAEAGSIVIRKRAHGEHVHVCLACLAEPGDLPALCPHGDADNRPPSG